MTNIPEPLRIFVKDRAFHKCEYCLLHEMDAYQPFHVDHIIALKHGGQTTADNLALSCQHCNQYKGTDLASIDPKSGNMTSFFGPRHQAWVDHFQHRPDGYIDAWTAVGRVTEKLLKLNLLHRWHARWILIQQGHYPR